MSMEGDSENHEVARLSGCVLVLTSQLLHSGSVQTATGTERA